MTQQAQDATVRPPEDLGLDSIGTQSLDIGSQKGLL